MPRIFDNIELNLLLHALQETLPVVLHESSSEGVSL